MKDLKEIREKQQKIVAEARAKLDEINKDTDEARAKELEDQYDKAMAEYDALDKRANRLEQLEEREKSLSIPADDIPVQEDRSIEADKPEFEHDEVFERFLRYGVGELTREERNYMKELRAQAAGTDNKGGYTVPQGFMNTVIESFKFAGPMMDPGVTDVVVTSSGNQIEVPTSDDTANKGALLAENTQDSEQDVTFGQKLIDAYKYTSRIIRISEELLQDNEVNIEQRLGNAMGIRIGRIANEHLTVGDGSAKPNGIVNASSQGVETAGASAVTFDEILDLIHSVDVAYRNGGMSEFMFHDSTLKVLRKIKDSEGNYIWQPADARTGAPASLFSYDYHINNDMPELGTGNKFMTFGDMSYYLVRRVREFAVKRLVERYADYHQVGFIGFARFDGELLNTSAVKHAVNA